MPLLGPGRLPAGRGVPLPPRPFGESGAADAVGESFPTLSAELRAQPDLAHCSDLGAFVVKKYAPAVERARELVPSKNKRFAEFARVVALAPRALIAEFDLDPDLDSESDSEARGRRRGGLLR